MKTGEIKDLVMRGAQMFAGYRLFDGWSDDDIIMGVAGDSGQLVMMRRLKDSIERSNRSMNLLTVVICICTVLLLAAAVVTIILQVKGCR